MKLDANILFALQSKRPFLWINPAYQPGFSPEGPSRRDIQAAEQRFIKAVPLLKALFSEQVNGNEVIDSMLQPAAALQASQGLTPETAGHWLLKRDDALPIVGSIKARGGFHEILAHAEQLAQQQGLSTQPDLRALATPAAKALFAHYQISVGSTGNLGLSIGTLAAALGFQATVHMSVEAKAWKKQKLREQGVKVVEHSGDYAAAVAVGRQQAAADANTHFVDDEHSLMLFLGYAASARGVAQQLRAQGRQVDSQHPLFVYLPCGVGGAPGGITYGLKALFGAHVHCFFVEPVASPCMLVQLANQDEQGVSVYDIGLDNRTEADGLAVAQASDLVAPLMKTLLSGVLTVSDNDLYDGLWQAQQALTARLEPSAAAALAGPQRLLASAEGQGYLQAQGINTANITHVMWTTGGAMVPEAEYQAFLARGQELNNP